MSSSSRGSVALPESKLHGIHWKWFAPICSSASQRLFRAKHIKCVISTENRPFLSPALFLLLLKCINFNSNTEVENDSYGRLMGTPINGQMLWCLASGLHGWYIISGVIVAFFPQVSKFQNSFFLKLTFWKSAQKMRKKMRNTYPPQIRNHQPKDLNFQASKLGMTSKMTPSC